MNIMVKYKRLIVIMLAFFVTVTTIPLSTLTPGTMVLAEDDLLSEEEREMFLNLTLASTESIVSSVFSGLGYDTEDTLGVFDIISADASTGNINIAVHMPDRPSIVYNGHFSKSDISSKMQAIASENLLPIVVDSDPTLEYEAVKRAYKDIQQAIDKREGLDNVTIDMNVSMHPTTHKITYIISTYYTTADGQTKKLDSKNVTYAEMLAGKTSIEDTVISLIGDTISELNKNGSALTDAQVIALIESIIASNQITDEPITYTKVKNPNGDLVITFKSGDKTSTKIFKAGITKVEAEKETNDAMTEVGRVKNKINDEITKITGTTYEEGEEVFGMTTIQQVEPTGFVGGGYASGWRNIEHKKRMIPLQVWEVPNRKDSNGDPIKVPIYGEPFGKDPVTGLNRFLGYCPDGFPVTSPFFRNDANNGYNFWSRDKYYEPWRDSKLETLLTKYPQNRYRVSLKEIGGVDGNQLFNPLIWEGLKLDYSNYIKPSDEGKDWVNHMKINIPPTDETWGVAYFPSVIPGSGFWYAVVPLAPLLKRLTLYTYNLNFIFFSIKKDHSNKITMISLSFL